MDSPDTRAVRRITQILAWIGLIVVVILVFWGAVNAAILVSNTFSGISPEAAVTVTSKSLTEENEEVTETATSTEETTEEVTETEEEEEETPTTTQPVTPGTKTEETYTFTTNGYILNPNGRPDLVAHIVGVGIIDPSSNEFFATSTAASDNRIAVKFVIENIGDNVATPWDFRVVLPTINVHFFDSPTQDALLPGEKVEYVISFDGGKVGKDKDVVVNVDSGNYIKESDETNNIVKDKLTIFAAN